MSVLTVHASASPAQVRAWANHNGFKVGVRGRINPDAVKAYNKANHVKYVEAAHVKTTTVKVKDSRNRTVTRKVSPKVARALLVEAGVSVGARGRLSGAAVQAAYNLAKVDA